MHFYSNEEIEYLKEITPGRSNKEITKRFNEKFNLDQGEKAISAVRKRYGIKTGSDGRFSKGHIPFNKGKKGTGGWEPTQFKKGQIPLNHRPVGSERVNVYGYTEIKVAEPNKWRLKHQVVWEKSKGPIPRGHVIIFGDGNKRNLDINNLILISRRQLVTLNKKNLIQNNADLTRTAVIITDIYHNINKRK